MEAANVGSCPCIEVLVEEGGADVNMINETDGSHPLLLAAAAGERDFLSIMFRHIYVPLVLDIASDTVHILKMQGILELLSCCCLWGLK